MAQKKTTDSVSASNEFRPQPDKDSRLNESYLVLDDEVPPLDDNDVWTYQLSLESMIRRSLPDNMNGRYIAMVRMLGAQARKFNLALKEDDGT